MSLKSTLLSSAEGYHDSCSTDVMVTEPVGVQTVPYAELIMFSSCTFFHRFFLFSGED